MKKNKKKETKETSLKQMTIKTNNKNKSISLFTSLSSYISIYLPIYLYFCICLSPFPPLSLPPTVSSVKSNEECNACVEYHGLPGERLTLETRNASKLCELSSDSFFERG